MPGDQEGHEAMEKTIKANAVSDYHRRIEKTMKYLTIPCTRCGKARVEVPEKTKLKKNIVLVRCNFCNKNSRYNLIDHIDGSLGYTLSKWGRGKNGEDLLLVKRRIQRKYKDLSSCEIRLALDKAYGHTV